MAKWFLRDRGQVLGPYTTEQILEMRDRGTVASYHEVSTDKRLWKLIDDVPALSRNVAPRASAPPPVPRRAGAARAPREDEAYDDEPPPEQPRRKLGTQTLVIGGVVSLVLLGGVILIGLLVFRSKPRDTVSTATGPGPGSGAGPIQFTSQTPTRDRDKVLDESVGLVVAGVKMRSRDGVTSEVPLFGTGSGFVVSPDGHLVTNRHVVQEAVSYQGSANQRDDEKDLGSKPEPKIWVFFGPDNKFEADVGSAYVSLNHDIAVLKIDRPSSRHFALCKTNDADTPRFDQVFSLGFPVTDRKAQELMNPKNKVDGLIKGAPVERYFQTADFKHTKERGGIRKSAFLARPDVKYLETYVVTHDARIAHGNSGGPLITTDGTVVGINTRGIFNKVGGVSTLQEGQSYAQTLAQFRKEIDKHAPGAVWRDPADDR